MRIDRRDGLSHRDPLFQTIPLITGRLKSLHVNGSPRTIPDITASLSRSALLLEDLSINGGRESEPEHNPALAIPLFNRDLSPPRKLRLKSVRTELPWRNMVNLTSFSLLCILPGETPIRRVLDFLESAPHLREITLRITISRYGAQNGRLLLLTHLKRMVIYGGYIFLHLARPLTDPGWYEIDNMVKRTRPRVR